MWPLTSTSIWDIRKIELSSSLRIISKRMTFIYLSKQSCNSDVMKRRSSLKFKMIALRETLSRINQLQSMISKSSSQWVPLLIVRPMLLKSDSTHPKPWNPYLREEELIRREDQAGAELETHRLKSKKVREMKWETIIMKKRKHSILREKQICNLWSIHRTSMTLRSRMPSSLREQTMMQAPARMIWASMASQTLRCKPASCKLPWEKGIAWCSP